MGKVVPLKRKSTDQTWYGAVLDENGREIPITEAMIQRALNQLDARVHLPCPHRLAQRSRK